MYCTSRRGEGGNARRSDHGVDRILAEELWDHVEELGKENAARGINDEGYKSETHNEKSRGIEELVRAHPEGYRDAEEDGDKISKHLLCRLGERIKHAALADKVTEHKEADERRRVGNEYAGNIFRFPSLPNSSIGSKRPRISFIVTSNDIKLHTLTFYHIFGKDLVKKVVLAC